MALPAANMTMGMLNLPWLVQDHSSLECVCVIMSAKLALNLFLSRQQTFDIRLAAPECNKTQGNVGQANKFVGRSMKFAPVGVGMNVGEYFPISASPPSVKKIQDLVWVIFQVQRLTNSGFSDADENAIG
jgi:hypothetical protein